VKGAKMCTSHKEEEIENGIKAKKFNVKIYKN